MLFLLPVMYVMVSFLRDEYFETATQAFMLSYDIRRYVFALVLEKRKVLSLCIHTYIQTYIHIYTYMICVCCFWN